MQTQITHSIDFGARGNASDYRLHGWSKADPDFTWTLGNESSIRVPALEAPLGYFVEILLRPVQEPGQKMSILVNDTVIHETASVTPGMFAYEAPPMAEGPLVVTIRHPNAVQSGGRSVSLAVERIRILKSLGDWGKPPITPTNDLVTGFESLGVNCELGFIQRQMGAEPLGLLRFSGSLLPRVVNGIDSDWAGLTDPSEIIPFDNHGGWDVRHRKYALDFHTFVRLESANAEDIKRREIKRLAFLAQKLAADVRAAEKIFVIQRRETLSEEEALPLWLALRRKGPCCLLWLVSAGGQVGHVERVRNGLLRGYMGRFSVPGRQFEPDHDSWLPVLRAAAELQAS